MKLWSQLAEATKKKYRSKGVSAQRYNAWNKTSKKGKESLSRRGITKDEFLKAPSTRTVKYEATVRQVINRIVNLLPRVNSRTVERNVRAMNSGELQIARVASATKLRKLASGKGYRVVSWTKEPINPFWYR